MLMNVKIYIKRVCSNFLRHPAQCKQNTWHQANWEVSKHSYDRRFLFFWWRFGLVGNVVGRINEVNQRWARLVLGLVTVFKMVKPSLYVTSHPGQLSLAIPPRVGKMSTGDDYGHPQGRNGEFCVTVGPVTRTAGILTQSVIWRTWAVC